MTALSTTLSTSTLTRPRIQLVIQSGCSKISLSIKWGYPPFSICPRLRSTVCISGLILRLYIFTTSSSSPRRITAILPSSRYTTLSVYSISGLASEPMKNSSLPIPTTSGDCLRAAIIWSGSLRSSKAMAYAPITSCRANCTAVRRSMFFCSRIYSISCTNTSVSVSLMNLTPLATSFALRSE